jgi:hypothetical protein
MISEMATNSLGPVLCKRQLQPNKMNFLPQSTRRVAMEGSGHDPLGLSRVSDALTNFLLPSIITTTHRGALLFLLHLGYRRH